MYGVGKGQAVMHVSFTQCAHTHVNDITSHTCGLTGFYSALNNSLHLDSKHTFLLSLYRHLVAQLCKHTTQTYPMAAN